MTTKGERGEGKKQSLLYSQVPETQLLYSRRGVTQEGAPKSKFIQAGGEPRENEGLWASAFIGSQGGVGKRRHEGISLVHLNIMRSLSGEGNKGNLWQGPALPCWCTWSPGQNAQDLTVGILGQQDNMNV